MIREPNQHWANEMPLDEWEERYSYRYVADSYETDEGVDYTEDYRPLHMWLLTYMDGFIGGIGMHSSNPLKEHDPISFEVFVHRSDPTRCMILITNERTLWGLRTERPNPDLIDCAY